MDLFTRITSFQNLYDAHLRARKSKRYRSAILRFGFSLEENLCAMRTDLMQETYIHGSYCEFIVTDSKKRIIQAAPFRDRVLHHALCYVIEPIFEKTFIYDSYACRIGKGTHQAVRRLQTYIRCVSQKHTESSLSRIYCLKCDIRKYFESVDHTVLLRLLHKRISDERVMRLCEIIIRSVPHGIPIGNLTSQLFANIYLNELDQYVKRVLHERCYIRYMDDFIIVSADKKRLHTDKECIAEFLRDILHIELHPRKSEIFSIERGIDFLGYRVFPQYMTLRKSTVKRIKKKMRRTVRRFKQGNISLINIYSFIHAWDGYAKHARSWYVCRNIQDIYSGVFFE